MEVFNVSVIQIYKRTIVHWLITSDLPANISFLSLIITDHNRGSLKEKNTY